MELIHLKYYLEFKQQPNCKIQMLKSYWHWVDGQTLLEINIQNW